MRHSIENNTLTMYLEGRITSGNAEDFSNAMGALVVGEPNLAQRDTIAVVLGCHVGLDRRTYGNSHGVFSKTDNYRQQGYRR